MKYKTHTEQTYTNSSRRPTPVGMSLEWLRGEIDKANEHRDNLLRRAHKLQTARIRAEVLDVLDATEVAAGWVQPEPIVPLPAGSIGADELANLCSAVAELMARAADDADLARNI